MCVILINKELWWWFPGGTVGKESACQCRRHKRHRFPPWVGTMPWRRAWHPLHILAWRIPWREEPGGLQSMELQRVRHDWAHTHTVLTQWGQKAYPLPTSQESLDIAKLNEKLYPCTISSSQRQESPQFQEMLQPRGPQNCSSAPLFCMWGDGDPGAVSHLLGSIYLADGMAIPRVSTPNVFLC